MIGVVRSWTRSSSGPPVGTVVFRPDVLEGSEVGSEGDGGSWRLVKDGEDEVPVRIMSSGEGLRLESIEGISAIDVRAASYYGVITPLALTAWIRLADTKHAHHLPLSHSSGQPPSLLHSGSPLPPSPRKSGPTPLLHCPTLACLAEGGKGCAGGRKS